MLRHVDLVAREHAGQLGRLVGLGHEGLERGVERLVAERGAVLDLQLEAADGAEALHRRRREHRDEGVLDGGELLVQLAGDRRRRSGRASLRSSNGFSVDEHDAGVRAVGEAVDRQARETRPRFSTPGCFSAMSPMRRITSSVRSSVAPSGSCAKPTRYCLSCARHEAARHRLEQADRGADQHEVDAPSSRPCARSPSSTPPL